MVQKKAPDKGPVESKKSHGKPDKRLYSHHHRRQDRRGGGGAGAGDLRRMLNKSRSIKVLEESLDSPLGDQLVQLGKPPTTTKKCRPSPVAEPNYMKSTSSSNARKEQLATQVSSNAPPSRAAAGANNNNHHPHRIAEKCSKYSDRRKSPSSGAASSPKPSKLLSRKSSLRPVRPAMKKSSGIPLCPTINTSRATCSSTMKETSFPDHLDLNPGGIDAEGTSVLKVCPFTYCSLNGHRHAPLPPLKCFLSARRRMLKTQKSMKLMKGLLSLRRTGPEEMDGVEIGTGGAELQGVSPVAEDLGDGFFLEIYAKRREDTSQPPTLGGDDVLLLHPEAAAYGTPPSSAGVDGEIGEDDGRSLIDDSGTEITWDDDNFDGSSDFSPSEMEVLIDFLEYVECDAEDPLCPSQEDDDDADWSYADCCITTDDTSGIGDEGIYEPASDAADMDWGEQDDFYIDFDEITCSELSEEGHTDKLPFEIHVGCNEAPVEAFSALPDEEDDERTVVAEAASGEDDSSRSVEVAVDEELGLADEGGNPAEEATEDDTSSSSELDQKGMLEEDEAEQAAAAAGQETEDQMVVGITGTHCDPFSGDDMDMEGGRDAEDEETDVCAETPASQIDSVAPPTAEGADERDDDGMEQEIAIAETEEEEQEKVESDQDEASSSEMETWMSEKEDDSQVLDEMPVQGESAASEVCADTPTGCTEGKGGATTSAVTIFEEEPTEAGNEPRARAVMTRKKVGGDDEEPGPFNPRPPNFLPVEQDPEAEKVDLRHQLVDERKNSEEWMIDYALRRAVDKLAPGRKRKVALLVEAFEAVAPMPRYGSTLGHSTVGFARAHPIQACS